MDLTDKYMNEGKKYPAKAVDFNKVKNSEGFWDLEIKEANRLGGLSWGRQTNVADIIMWLNMAAMQWEDRQK